MLDESMGMLLQLNADTRIRKMVRPHEKMNAFTACKTAPSFDPGLK